MEERKEPVPQAASEGKVQKAAAVTEVAPERPVESDNSARVLEGLDAVTQRVFSLMPIDRAVSPDEFTSAGVGIAEAITALTMLELSGLAESLPGGTYIRK